MPHVVPTGFHLDPETESIKIGGHAYRGQDRLYIRHLKVNPNAAFVIDDLVTEPNWTPCAVTIKGPVQIHESGVVQHMNQCSRLRCGRVRLVGRSNELQ